MHTHTCLRTCSLKTIMQKLGSLKLNTTGNWEKLSRYLPLLGFNSLQNLLFPDFFPQHYQSVTVAALCF